MTLKVIGLIVLVTIGGFVLSTALKIPLSNVLGQTSELTSQLEMGATELYVKDLPTMKQFYVELVGLEVLTENEQEVTLGFKDRAILNLIASPTLPVPAPRSAGLYHNAIVFSSRAVLAQTLEKILTTNASSFIGSSDHRVSEAFYFTDPEGNGLELYFDKSQDTWEWQNGQIVMGSTYIDPVNYIQQYGKTSDTPEKKMGHVHLKVGDLQQAKAFYVETLGMTITAETPGALFVSDGKYHHHLGLNTWESAGAGKREQTLGLKSFELRLATSNDLEKLKKRLQKSEQPYEETTSGITLQDPWGNQLVVSVF